MISQTDAIAGRTSCRTVSPAKILGEGQQPRRDREGKRQVRNVVQIRITWEIIHVTYAAEKAMKGEFLKVSWNMSRISNPNGRSIVNFIEDWSKK